MAQEPSRSVGDYLGDVGAALGQGANAAVEGVAGLATMVTDLPNRAIHGDNYVSLLDMVQPYTQSGAAYWQDKKSDISKKEEQAFQLGMNTQELDEYWDYKKI